MLNFLQVVLPSCLQASVRRGVHGVAGYVVDAVLPIARVRAGQRVRDGHGGAEVAPAHVQVHVLTRVRTADGRQHSAAALPERKETFIGPENFLFFEGLNGSLYSSRVVLNRTFI